ncbi:site-2 protease family protein [Microtetraspora sp. NBRC 16547]|uniref:site-2 protease family protein n=1 Tax=Microtetraspora sp. NBRC 16547 TaxID=3030993 RepID=UPI0024A3FF3F|nr:site-2 protease family protein [Microtetraspora sp. NBRC 16547]GLW98580.1 putative zinc metalloprotease Rip3 [Microtetraspora sp. NBRC 16547]
MKQSLRLGQVAGIPVGVHWSVLVIAALIAASLGGGVLPGAAPGQVPGLYWTIAVATSVLFLASLLAHELAHALVARWRAVPVQSITLWLFGGVTQMQGEARTPRNELEISVVGPLTSLAVAGLAFVMAAFMPGPRLVLSALMWLALMNLLLGVFNMLPGAPLDGGRVLHAVLWWRTRDRARADRAAARAGQGLGLLLVGLGMAEVLFTSWAGGLWLMIIGWFLAGAAGTEMAARSAREGLGGVRIRDVMTPLPDLAPAWLDVEEFVSGVASRSHQSVFPVVAFGGEPIGYVNLEALAAVPPSQRGSTRLDRLARPLPPDRILGPDDDAATLLERPTMGPMVALVIEGGHVAGMVTAQDLSRMVRLALLRRAS